MVSGQGEQGEDRGDEGVAIGQKGNRHGVGVIDGEQECGQAGGEGGTHDIAIEQADEQDEQTVPEDTLGVHERWVAGPEPVIEQMGEAGERAPEGGFGVGIGPPGQVAGVHEGVVGLGIAGEEMEQVERPAGIAGKVFVLIGGIGKDRAVPIVIGQPAGAQGRQGQKNTDGGCQQGSGRVDQEDGQFFAQLHNHD